MGEALPVLHASYVPKPAQLPTSDVLVDGVEPKLSLKRCGRHTVLPRVLARDARQNAEYKIPTAPSASFKLEKTRDGQNTEEVGKITRELMKEDRIQNTRLKNPTV